MFHLLKSPIVRVVRCGGGVLFVSEATQEGVVLNRRHTNFTNLIFQLCQ